MLEVVCRTPCEVLFFDEETLKTLEHEKAALLKKANSLLGTLGLNLDDLSPRYICDKCKDTGYVGTHRCDCLNKARAE